MSGFQLKLDLGGGLSVQTLDKAQSKALFELVDKNRSHLSRFLPWVDSTKTEADTQNFIDSCSFESIYDGQYPIAILFNEKIIGMTGYNRGDSASQKVDIGYWLSTDWTGKGLVSKTTKALIDFAFNETDVQKVYIKCATSNLRSQGIPRRLRLHKLEQSKDSCHDDGQLIPAQVYYIGREEWLERN